MCHIVTLGIDKALGSAAKIERALEARGSARARDREGQNARRLRRDRVLASRRSSLRVFVYMYSGAFDSESIGCSRSIRMTVHEYQRQHGVLPEDVLVEIVGPAR